MWFSNNVAGENHALSASIPSTRFLQRNLTLWVKIALVELNFTTETLTSRRTSQELHQLIPEPSYLTKKQIF